MNSTRSLRAVLAGMTAAGLLATLGTVATGTSLTNAVGLTGKKDDESSAPAEANAASGGEVIADADGSGVEVSQRFFETSDTVVVSDGERDNQLHAAAIAIDLGAPMLTAREKTEAAVDEEIARLGAERVITVPADNASGDGGETEPIKAEKGKEVAAIVDKRGASDGEPIFVSGDTSLAAATTLVAAGTSPTVLEYADPRVTAEAMELTRSRDTLAVGRQFGTTEDYRKRAELASGGELPGGGGLVFPGRRMIALYGHPSGPALGALGEQPPAESVERLKGLIDAYQPLADEPVIPAFEIIATVASSDPGDDGDFANESKPEELVPYIDAITEAGGYAVIDLQPGLARFLDQAKIYEELLKRPNVGLALDPEWKLKPGQQPAAQIGAVDAEEINEVTEWLAELVRENDLPQKALIIHQFNMAMLPDRENINVNAPELSFVLHADGHGTPGQKFDTWDMLRKDLDAGFFMAWKNFFDEDQPMFDPAKTFNDVAPRPWFVSYQ